MPFKLVGSSAIQTFTVVITKIEQNVNVDPARFAKPAASNGRLEDDATRRTCYEREPSRRAATARKRS